MCECPMVKVALSSSWPYSPPPRSLPYTAALTVTLVPEVQYCCGRQCTSWLSIQYQPPTTPGGSVVTDSVRSAAALSVMGSSNQTVIGWPTPNVPPLSRVPTLARRYG